MPPPKHPPRVAQRLVPFFFLRIFPLIFLSVGLLLMGFAGRDAVRAARSPDWPTASGTVRVSEVIEGGGDYPYPYVEYEFVVDGNPYRSHQIAYGHGGTRESASATVARFPRGEPVTVYFLPGNPAVSVIKPGLDVMLWVIVGIGLVLALVGGGLLGLFLRARD